MVTFIINNALLLLFILSVIVIVVSPYITFHIPHWVLDLGIAFEFIFVSTFLIFKLGSNPLTTVGYFPELGTFDKFMACLGYALLYFVIYLQLEVLVETTFEKDKIYKIRRAGVWQMPVGASGYVDVFIKKDGCTIPIMLTYPEGYDRLRGDIDLKYISVKFVRREKGWKNPRVVMIASNVEELSPKLKPNQKCEFHIVYKCGPRITGEFSKWVSFETGGYFMVGDVKFDAVTYSHAVYNLYKKGDVVPMTYYCEKDFKILVYHDSNSLESYYSKDLVAKRLAELENKVLYFYPVGKYISEPSNGEKQYICDGYVKCGDEYYSARSFNKRIYLKKDKEYPIKVRIGKKMLKPSFIVCPIKANKTQTA